MATLTANLTYIGVAATDAAALTAASAGTFTDANVYAEPIVTTTAFGFTANPADGVTITMGAAAVISGEGTVTKSGAGTLVLGQTAANTYEGITTLGAGTLQYSHNNQLGAVPTAADADNITINGGTLAFNGGADNRTIAATKGFTFGGDATISNVSTVASGDAGSLFIDAPMVGSTHGITFAGLNADGSSVRVINLGGAIAGTGTVTVNRGATLNLELDATMAQDVTVNGDLRGGVQTDASNDSFAGNITVNDNGRLLPGGTVGSVMRLGGTLTMANGSEMWISYDHDGTNFSNDSIAFSATTGAVATIAASVNLYGIALTGATAVPASTVFNIMTKDTGATYGADLATNLTPVAWDANQVTSTSEATTTIGAYAVAVATDNVTLTVG